MKAKLAPPKVQTGKITTKVSVRAPAQRAPVMTELSRARLQPSLKVGPANDPLEHEADAMADRVLAMSAPIQAEAPPPSENRPSNPSDGGAAPSTPSAPPLSNEAQGPHRLHRDLGGQPNLDTLDANPALDAAEQEPSLGPDEDVKTDTLDGDDMGEIESGKPDAVSNDAASEGAVQAKPIARDPQDGLTMGAEGGIAPHDVSARVTRPGAGRPLPASVRNFMEPRFGEDFSDVRIHDEAQDHATAARIGARAFTYKNRIWMGKGESVDNKRLMAHELTHVVQQTKRGTSKHASTPQTSDAKAHREVTPSLQRGWVADKAESYARQVPGYTLVCVLLGKSPITGRTVVRNAVNIIGGFLGLIPGGTYVFDKLREAKIIEEAYTWVTSRLSQLNLTWSRVKGLIKQAIDVFPTWSPLESIKKIFAPLIRDIKTFAGEIKDKVLSFIIKGALKLAGPYGDKIWKFVQKAGNIIKIIFENPIGFAKNLIGGIVGGFKLFGRNIIEHLKRGLLGWLFGALSSAGLQLPAKLDFKGLMSIGLQVLGLSYDKFRTKLVKRLGPKGEQKVGFLEKSVEVVKILATQGFLGIWKKMLSMIDNFKQTLIGSIQTFVIQTVIEAGIGWLAGLSNPIGAIFRVIKAIYDLVKVFIERFDEIVALANTIFDSIGAIAAGQVAGAAKLVEKAIGATVPVVISFLAGLLGLGGLPGRIKSVIKKIQKPIDKALDKLLTFLVKKAKKLLAKLLGKLNSKRKLPGAKFKIAKVQHRLFFKTKGRGKAAKSELWINTKATPVKKATQTLRQEVQEDQPAQAQQTLAFAQARDKEATTLETTANQVAQAPKDRSTRAQNTSADTALNAAAQSSEAEAQQVLNLAGKPGSSIIAKPDEDGDKDHPEESYIRFISLRSKLEGTVNSYSALRKSIQRNINEAKEYYEADHVPNQAVLQRIQKWMMDTGKAASTSAANKKPPMRLAPPTKNGASLGSEEELAQDLGLLSTRNAYENAESFPAILLFKEIHDYKNSNFPNKADLTALDKILTPTATTAHIKTFLKTHIDQEIDRIKQSYGAKPGQNQADRDIITTALANLPTLKTRAIEALNLGAAAATTQTTSATPAKAERTPFKAGSGHMLIDPKGSSEQPDFTQVECRPFIYHTGAGGGAKFGVLQLDHNIDQVFHSQAKAAKFETLLPDDVMTAHVKDGDQINGNPKPSENWAAVKAHKVFTPHDKMSLTANQVDTLMIARRVHSALSSLSRDKPTVNSEYQGLLQAKAANIGTSMAQSQDDALKQARDHAKDALKPYFQTRFNDRAAEIERIYSGDELTKIAEDNGGGDKGVAAQTFFRNKVLAHLPTSLRHMRTQNDSLFGPK
ncbi:eCIS core domain-containing protein [Woodsholea maritima]|uniref:eCIS core domain-containing protein n=1 Tax=Woodsholea maritima TaxID=240237 RepID=UPI00037256E4|nr:DUF4157 domain-containing protein [Woodsholea maritima]